MLHKTSRVRGFHIHASDGQIGHVDDFLFDDACAIKYLVVDTSNFLGGKWVLISTPSIQRIDSANKAIYVAAKRDEIKHGPSLDSVDIQFDETLPTYMIL